MSIKGDKTFEEIVERLVALFRPQQEDATARADARAPASSSESVERSSSPSTAPPSNENPPD